MADALARLRAELRAHRTETDEERFRAFPPLTLLARAGGDGRTYVLMLEEVGYLTRVGGD